MWILTMIDHFTRWPVAIPIPNRTSEVIANAIFKYWICEKGVPARVLLETGRDPILPAHAMFPFLHEERADEESYVIRIQESLNFAFERAQMLQQEMTEKNKARMAQNQYDPGFKEGDLLLVWEKSSAES